jgi:lipopolysaccharide export system ATP-binding protein
MTEIARPPSVPESAKRRGRGAPRPAQDGLVVDRIGKAFRGRQVVKGVSLRLARGEVAGLLGPNGAGKTTCFYMITGLIAADYGAIWLDGEDITNQPMYQRARLGLGYLPQETSIFRGMTVEQNVMAVVEMRESSRERVRAITSELLDELHIAHLRSSAAVSLSGGERRRVEIARALASEPAFMLLDEPFAGIDPLAIADIREVIRYLQRRGIGILITDHNVRETLDIIDRASIIHAGEVLFEGSPEEILADPEVRRVYLGDRFG